MRAFSRPIIRFSFQALLTGLIISPAWSQITVPNQAPVQNYAPDAATQQNAQPKELNFAEKQYLSPQDAISYRDKYSTSCLIYVYDRNFLSVDITIFSTYKINRCDPRVFIKTTAAGVKAQLTNRLNTDFVILSGPHIQMMDFNNTPVENRFIPIGPLNYSPVAKAHLGPIDIIRSFYQWSAWIRSMQYYSVLHTTQDADFTWYPGSRIYKLINDQDETFIMTNLISMDEMHNEEDIEKIAINLGKYLNLPKGWRYEISVLDKVLQLRQRQFSGEHAGHLQDEYGNIYMQLKEQN